MPRSSVAQRRIRTGKLLAAVAAFCLVVSLMQFGCGLNILPGPVWMDTLAPVQIIECGTQAGPEGGVIHTLGLDLEGGPGGPPDGVVDTTIDSEIHRFRAGYQPGDRIWVYWTQRGDDYDVQVFTWAYFLATPPFLFPCAILLVLAGCGLVRSGRRTLAHRALHEACIKQREQEAQHKQK